MAKGRSVTRENAETTIHAPAWKAKGRPANARTKEIAAPKPRKRAMKAFVGTSHTKQKPIMAIQNKIASIIRSIRPVGKSEQVIHVRRFAFPRGHFSSF